MKRHVHVAVLALVAVAPLAAQAPKGWKMRVDRSTAASDPDAAGRYQVRHHGIGLPCDQSPSGGVLESGEYRVGRLIRSRARLR